MSTKKNENVEAHDAEVKNEDVELTELEQIEILKEKVDAFIAMGPKFDRFVNSVEKFNDDVRLLRNQYKSIEDEKQEELNLYGKIKKQINLKNATYMVIGATAAITIMKVIDYYKSSDDDVDSGEQVMAMDALE